MSLVKERVKREFRPKKRVMLVWFLEKGVVHALIGLLVLFLFLNLFVSSGLIIHPDVIILFVLLGFIVLSVLFFFVLYEYLTHKYLVLRVHLYVKKPRNFNRVALRDVVSVSVSQNRLEKFLRIGKVSITTKDQVIILEGVHHPFAFKDELLRVIQESYP